VSAKQSLGPGLLLSKSLAAGTVITAQTLFTVANGAVVVTALFGRVTTAIGGTATTLSLGTGAGGGTALATATAITSKAAGTWLFAIAPTGAAAGALQVVGPSSAYLGGSTNFPNPPEWPPGIGAPFLLAPDTINYTLSANPGGGVIQWYINYVPIDTGVAVS
jgi:hypothetical protein